MTNSKKNWKSVGGGGGEGRGGKRNYKGSTYIVNWFYVYHLEYIKNSNVLLFGSSKK